MSKRALLYVATVVATLIFGAIFQPLARLTSLAQAQGGCQTFPQTGKQVCGRFLDYWTKSGGLAQQGLPLSGEFQEKSDLNGQVYTVQYFERAVFEKHPENAAPYDVLLSQLGTFQFKSKYPNGEGGSVAPAPTAVVVPGKIYSFGEDVTLAPGITLQAYSFKLERTSPSSEPHMFWNMHISNKSGTDWPLQVAIAEISVRDNLGNNFPVDETSAKYSPVVKPDKPFATELWIFTRNQQIFETAKYFDLTINSISGVKGPWTFRRVIQP